MCSAWHNKTYVLLCKYKWALWWSVLIHVGGSELEVEEEGLSPHCASSTLARDWCRWSPSPFPLMPLELHPHNPPSSLFTDWALVHQSLFRTCHTTAKPFPVFTLPSMRALDWATHLLAIHFRRALVYSSVKWGAARKSNMSRISLC